MEPRLQDQPEPTDYPWRCQHCREPATHVHLLPYDHLAREPERAVLACGAHEPGGYRFTLDDWLVGDVDLRDDDEEVRYTRRDHLLETKIHGAAAVKLVDELIDHPDDLPPLVELPERTTAAMLLDAAFGPDADEEFEREVARLEAEGRKPEPVEPDWMNELPRISRLRVLDTHRLLTTEPPPLDWLAEGVWCRGKLTLVGGREKRGKSLVQLALAVCMAAGGGDIADIAVKPGRVLLVDGENGEREDHRRLRAIGLEAAYAENLTIAEARGFDLRENLDELDDLITQARADLVLLDSYRALWLGDERDEAAVAAALDPLRAIAHDRDIAIGLTHHAQKGGDEYRGSSAIGASIEWCVMLERVHDDPQKATRRRLTNPLARFAPEREDHWLQIVSEGDDGPVSLKAAQPFVPTHEAPVRDEVQATLLDYINGVSGVTSSNGGDTLTPLSWSTADLCRALGRDPKDQTTRRAVQSIANDGVIYRGDDSRWYRADGLFSRNGRPAGEADR